MKTTFKNITLFFLRYCLRTRKFMSFFPFWTFIVDGKFTIPFPQKNKKCTWRIRKNNIMSIIRLDNVINGIFSGSNIQSWIKIELVRGKLDGSILVRQYNHDELSKTEFYPDVHTARCPYFKKFWETSKKVSKSWNYFILNWKLI